MIEFSCLFGTTHLCRPWIQGNNMQRMWTGTQSAEQERSLPVPVCGGVLLQHARGPVRVHEVGKVIIRRIYCPVPTCRRGQRLAARERHLRRN